MATKLTVTEALQEIKTIGLRLQKKRAAITSYIARDAKLRDPFEKDGGVERFIASERQAITDLESRMVAIRTAITRVNLNNKLTVGDITKTVAEWLTWRRELSQSDVKFLNDMVTSIATVRTRVQGRNAGIVGGVVQAQAGDPAEVTVAVNEKALVSELETMETVLGELDGKLSLYNATCTIEC